jgi:hypothetical protein
MIGMRTAFKISLAWASLSASHQRFQDANGDLFPGFLDCFEFRAVGHF